MDVRGTAAERDVRDLRRSLYALGALFPKSPLRRAVFLFVFAACLLIQVLQLRFSNQRSIPVGILLLALQSALSIGSTVFWYLRPAASTGTLDALSKFFCLNEFTDTATAQINKSHLRWAWGSLGVFLVGKALAERTPTTDKQQMKDFIMAILSTCSSTYLTGAAIITWSSYSLVCDSLFSKLEQFRLPPADTGADLDVTVEPPESFKTLLSLKEAVQHVSKTFEIYLLSSFLLVTIQIQLALYSLTAFHRLDNKTNIISFLDIFVTYVIWMWYCLLAAVRVSGKSKDIYSIVTAWHLKETFKSPHNDPSFVRTSIERQALVMNAAGLPALTVFGYSIDSGLTIAIFQFQLGLIQFVLGKTVSFPMDHKV